MTHATVKIFHDLKKMREKGYNDFLLGINDVDFLPCKCQDCRDAYRDGQAEGLFVRSKQNEHGKNGA